MTAPDMSLTPDAFGIAQSYSEAADAFDVSNALRMILPHGTDQINAAEICCDRHASDAERVALLHRSQSGDVRSWTFAELRSCSSQFAEVLAAHGVGKSDRVAGLLPRTPELLITILATWRLGAVYQPLFTAFGPKAIEHRASEAGTRFIVTNTANRDKLGALAVPLAVVDAGEADAAVDFWRLLKARPGTIAATPCTIDDPFLIMFTSGTTGPAKALLVPLKAIAAFVGYMRDAVGLRDEDRFWNVADEAAASTFAGGSSNTLYDAPGASGFTALHRGTV